MSLPTVILIAIASAVLGSVIGWQLSKRRVRKEMAAMQAEINLRSIEVLEAKTHLRKLSAHLSTSVKSLATKSDLLARQHSLLVSTDKKLADTQRSHSESTQQYEAAIGSLKQHVTNLAKYVRLMRKHDEQKSAAGTTQMPEHIPARTSVRTQATPPVSMPEPVPAPVSIQAVKQPDNTVQITRIDSPRIAAKQATRSVATASHAESAHQLASQASAVRRKRPL